MKYLKQNKNKKHNYYFFMKKSKLLLGAVLGLGLASATAQELSVDALIRPRFEYRNGFQDVASDGVDGSAFVSQRSSLLLKYTDTVFTTFLDFQSVDVWGDRSQLQTAAVNDNANGGLRLNQAWAEVKLGNGFSTKVGRQIINLDDQRIFGGVGWTQQQRTHDAALVKYAKGGFKAQLGFGFNQNGEGNQGNLFIASGAGQPLFQYKGLQYLHLNNKFSDSFSGSFLFVNNQFQDVTVDADGDTIGDGTNSRQLTGIHGKYKKGKFKLDFSGYYQFGEIGSAGTNVSAWDAAINATYKVGSTVIGAGVEALSGNDADTAQNEAFFPLFGTNHKFNGYQDFFFVGRHANNAGLLDVNAKAIFKLAPKAKFLAHAHLFKGLTEVGQGDDIYGTSIDLVYIQPINKWANIKVGYSQSFFDDDFADERAVSGDADDIQNWGWVQLTIKPNLFKWKKPAETK